MNQNPTIQIDGRPDSFVHLRRYLLECCDRLWPAHRSGKSGRPSGGGFKRLATEMGVSRARISRIISDAERTNTIKLRDVQRMADALGLNPVPTFLDHHYAWAHALKETP